MKSLLNMRSRLREYKKYDRSFRQVILLYFLQEIRYFDKLQLQMSFGAINNVQDLLITINKCEKFDIQKYKIRVLSQFPFSFEEALLSTFPHLIFLLIFYYQFAVLAKQFYKGSISENQTMAENNEHTAAITQNPQNKRLSNGAKFRNPTHQAVIKLKQAEKHIDTLKRRCSKLKVQQQKNRYKTVDHERKLKFLESVKQQTERQKAIIQKAQIKRSMEVQKIKQKNNQVKQMYKSRLSAVRERFTNQKVEDYIKARQSSKKNDKIIVQIKKQDLTEKQEIRKEINKLEAEQKQHIQKYLNEKVIEIKKKRKNDTEDVLGMLKKREFELQKINSIQQEMIKKHAESMQASQIMRNKLRSVLGTSIEGRVNKLPEIRKRHISSEHSTDFTTIQL